MSDYSFMRSGFESNHSSQPNINQEDLVQLLNLFISNAVITSSKYVKLCKRNSITKKDLEYGIKLETKDFFNRNTLIDDLNEIKQDFENLKNEEIIKYRIEYVNSYTGVKESVEELFDSEESADNFIDNKLENYCTDITLIELTQSDLDMESMTEINESEMDNFSLISNDNYSKLNASDKEFVDNLHKAHDSWDSWTPEIPIQRIMKDLVSKHDLSNY